MTQINQLSAIDQLSSGDNFPVFSTGNGDTRRVSAGTILEYIQSNTATYSSFGTQYAAPSATGFSVTISPTIAGDNTHLILTPVAGYDAGTIVLPAVATVVNKQEILVNCTQSVTTLTVNGNGAVAVTGAPTTLAANAFFRLKYDAVMRTWYRVG